jgi:phosphohistidine phosphatase
VVSDKLYHATSNELLSLLRGLDEDFQKALVIGHNPGLHDLSVTLLSAGSVVEKPKASRRLLQGFPTASLAEFEFSGSWTGLAAGSGELRRFVRPKDLLTAAS